MIQTPEVREHCTCTEVHVGFVYFYTLVLREKILNSGVFIFVVGQIDMII